jgi:hypothetical protein
MKYSVMMGSGVMIYIPIYIQIRTAIRNKYGVGGYVGIQTHGQDGDLISLL